MKYKKGDYVIIYNKDTTYDLGEDEYVIGKIITIMPNSYTYPYRTVMIKNYNHMFINDILVFNDSEIRKKLTNDEVMIEVL